MNEPRNHNGCSNESCPGRTAIVSVGNLSRQDDGLASALVNRLRKLDMPGICLIDLGPYTSYLSSVLERHRKVLIIDSADSGQKPGEFTVLHIDDATRDSNAGKASLRSSHGLSFLDEILLAIKHLKSVPSITLFLVQPARTDYANELTESIQASLPVLTRALQSQIEAI